ncbi:MAG TPA: serine/threonine-protein kinase [Bryobacteraceae bacterium]|nr:serine/threonine-protein kinase [Bryobacteraceae bacterium]
MESIGRYRIVAELGRGGGGVVYKGVDPESNATVAIKTIPAMSGGEGALAQRLRREAQSASILAHRNIVRVLEYADDGPNAYFVMEFVEGATLEQSMRSGERIAIERALSIMRQTADALDYAHRRGIVHRDIKPANIMTTRDGVVKVADFGTAKMLDARGTQLTVAGSILGSPHYMSPEQVTESGVTGRSDQFSLAVIAYELLAGRKPFEGDFAPAVLYQIVSEPAPPLTSLQPELPAEADAVLQKALAKNPAERYTSCGEFVGALQAALGQRKPARGGAAGETGVGWRVRLWRWLRFWK